MATSALMCAVCPVKALGEVWAPVPLDGLGHYEVSTEGRVRNTRRAGRLLVLRAHPTGYMVVNLGRAHRNLYVHRLVCLAFLGPPPRDGHQYEGDHLYWERASNRIEHLRWLPKNVNAWRWRFWADQVSPEEQASYEDIPHGDLTKLADVFAEVERAPRDDWQDWSAV